MTSLKGITGRSDLEEEEEEDIFSALPTLYTDIDYLT